MAKDKTAFILGAGFSANAGLPLQSGFTKLFLQASTFTTGKSRLLMPDLDHFVQDSFGFKTGQDVSLYPELEDVFTMLDLAANTGHNLGRNYPPHELRRMRRMLLSRIIRMLHGAYVDGRDSPPAEREKLLHFVRSVSPVHHEFVSLNWDTVLEGCFEEIGLNFSPYYSPEIDPVSIGKRELKTFKPHNTEILVAKVHGSINWLYCDCCRRTFSVPVHQVRFLASQVLKESEEVELYGKKSHRILCPRCNVDLGVRLATFSYQKALRAASFESSWLQAEKTLRRSRRWVFIGYSLPGADFEFKYLLKRIALSLRPKPEVIVVTKVCKGTSPDDDRTVLSYKRFFGDSSPRFFCDSLTPDAVNEIL
jgi:hypothetical protein